MQICTWPIEAMPAECKMKAKWLRYFLLFSLLLLLFNRKYANLGSQSCKKPTISRINFLWILAIFHQKNQKLCAWANGGNGGQLFNDHRPSYNHFTKKIVFQLACQFCVYKTSPHVTEWYKTVETSVIY